MTDEEKSYHEWVAKNLEYIQQNKNHVNVMKKLYIEGFSAGYEYWQTCQAKEYLQK